jgi:hypothetical protein
MPLPFIPQVPNKETIVTPRKPAIEPELRKYIDDVLKVCSSRAAYVLGEILQHGEISSETIRNKGFIHGARAVGDVRDNGIPLITLKTKSNDGRSIARYILGSASEIKRHKFGGRVAFPARLKADLITETGEICAISNQELPASELQIDHRVPYYIAGDINAERNTEEFMLLSRSMQRSKSWACESCENIKVQFDIAICKTCYWAYPEAYDHIAMKRERRIDITFSEAEIDLFERLKALAKEKSQSIQQALLSILTTIFPRKH